MMVKEAKQKEKGENNILLVFVEGSTSLRAMAAGSRSFSKMLHGHVMSSFCQDDFTVDKGGLRLSHWFRVCFPTWCGIFRIESQMGQI